MEPSLRNVPSGLVPLEQKFHEMPELQEKKSIGASLGLSLHSLQSYEENSRVYLDLNARALDKSTD